VNIESALVGACVGFTTDERASEGYSEGRKVVGTTDGMADGKLQKAGASSSSSQQPQFSNSFLPLLKLFLFNFVLDYFL
jgi:hypothetical protein